MSQLGPKIRPPIKYHGGKGLLYKWILNNAPPHTIYVEPFGGAGSVLLNKTISPIEVYNDKSNGVFSLFYCLKNFFQEFYDIIKSIEYKKEIYEKYLEIYKSESFNLLPIIEKSVACYVVFRQSRAGTATTFCWSNRFLQGVPEEIYCWETSKNSLIHIHNRLQNVLLFNKDALSLLQEFDSEDTLFYLDPPYIHSKRVSKNVYKHELTESDHKNLIDCVKSLKGKVMISGYYSDEYNNWLNSWNYVKKESILHSSHSKSKQTKIEYIWKNF